MAESSSADRNKVLQKLHDAAGLGDVETVQHIFECHKHEFGINVYRKGGNTVLHTALYHSQEGILIDYLIRNGVNVNALNSKGYSPLLVAVIRCKEGDAANKLIAAGASIDAALEKATNINDKKAMKILTSLTEKKYCKEVNTKKSRGDYTNCPVCNILVRYPTRMSRIVGFQDEIDEKMQNHPNNGKPEKEEKGKKKKIVFTSRKYLDQLLAHSNGKAYEKLCNIEYHGVENMKIRKEISESFAILHAVQECCTVLALNEVQTAVDGIHLENIFLIDLCSGKGITTALCGALFPHDGDTGVDGNGSNNFFLAVDKLCAHEVPHFLNDKHISYLSRDILSDEMFQELEQVVHHQTQVEGRTAILVGMHLCGMLSERAIEFFDRIPEIKGLVLSPCCLPNKYDMYRKTSFKKEKSGDSYVAWCSHLQERVDGSGVSHLRQYSDDDMHTTKNVIIVGVRK